MAAVVPILLISAHSIWERAVSVVSNDFKETVRAQTDLVGLIQESISLSSRGGGRELVGLCPFHDDHNPSLHVYPDRQSYRCWVCNAGGDCFSWVMEFDKVEFREALEILARRANVAIPQRSGRGTAGAAAAGDEKARLYEVLQWAENLFHQTLLHEPYAAPARDYLHGRGYTDETIRTWKLGFHPDDWEWLQHRADGRYSLQLLEAAKLIGRSKDRGGYYDNYVNRVLFPICNERGQTLSFGGRILPGGDDRFGKYWNGPESTVYHKSRIVYGLHHAREAIRETKTIVAVEGYTDCISAHQAGLRNAVATCGTALTDMHVTTMRRFAGKIVLVFDGDQAGRDAAEKAVERFLAQDVDLRILTLPAGKDPADFLSEHSAEYLQQLADAAPEAWAYKFDAACNRHGLDTLAGRQRVLDDMLGVLAVAPKMATHIRKDMLLEHLASRLAVPEPQVRERFQQVAARSGKRPVGDHSPADGEQEVRHPGAARVLGGGFNFDDRLECELLETILAAPELAGHMAQEIEPELFRNESLRRLLTTCYSLFGQGTAPACEQVLRDVEDAELKRLVVWLDDRARRKHENMPHEPEESTEGCPAFLRESMERLKRRHEEQSQKRMAVELSANGDGAQRMDAKSEAQLRQLADFHQRRATQKARV